MNTQAKPAAVRKTPRITVTMVMAAFLLSVLILPNHYLVCASAQESVEVPFATEIRDEQLNGAIGYEWIDANNVEIGIDGFRSVIFLKHDGENLNLALQILTREEFERLELFVAFDANRNGAFYDQGDDILIITLQEGKLLKSDEIDYFYPETYQFASDRDFGGTNNALAVLSVDTMLIEGNIVYTAEFKKSLTGDADMDVALSPDDEVDIVIGFIGESSPAVERVSDPIKIWLKKKLSAVVPQRYVGKVLYGDYDSDKKFEIRIPRKGAASIDIDPDKFPAPGPKMKYDGDAVTDYVWSRQIGSEKVLVVDLDGDKTIDIVQDGNGKKWSVGLNPNRIWIFDTKIPTLTCRVGAVPAGAQITIIDKTGNSQTVTANDDGSTGFIKLNKLKIKGTEHATTVIGKGGKIIISFK